MIERDLMRLLHGELSAERAARLEARLAREPELARRYRRMAEAWGSLELPPPAPAPPGFAARVAARAEEVGVRAEAEAFSPAWVRAVGALLVAVGVTAGAALSWLAMPPAITVETPSTQAATSASSTGSFETEESLPSLAEAYWTALGSEQTGAADTGSVR